MGIISRLLAPLVEELVEGLMGYVDVKLNNIVDLVFYADNFMAKSTGTDFTSITTIIYSFAIYLIILKFLIKGLNVYILWQDGDSDLDPFVILTSFFKSIIIAISFSTIYDIFARLSKDIINQISGSVTDSYNLEELLGLGTSLTSLILLLVFVILYMVLYLQFIKRGIEMFLLKLGVPFACVGLMDSDGGVFKVYTKKFIQIAFTIMSQIFLLKLALLLVLSGKLVWGIGVMFMILSAPKFLNEFLMLSGGGGGVVTKTGQVMQMASMAKSMVKK